uniref:Uncharacterized protein LOC104246830 n=1 Tax=Nicotiana sylvestris TaxID=4096 RepID=A0A1U7YP68_NICSY|nr:PREDICTED: uncharacterized protein LOC104246830 [Nicotiana sylvestris]
MLSTLAKAGLIPLAPTTSQAGGGAQTPTTRTPEQRAHVDQAPESHRDAWCVEFEQLRQGSMTVSEYAVRFSDLARHAPALVATFSERICRFIEGFNPCIRFSMARELEMDIAYQQVVGIARRLEDMWSPET